jgi:CO/xanthine dehydrogenase Mo-binding subunit
MDETHVVGKKIAPLRSREILTGKARYCPDLTFPGMLVGKILYSKVGNAHVRKIDVRAAKALPGVVAVLTHEDIPGENSYVFVDTDQPLLVSDRVAYPGDMLAAVAAETEEIALAALDAIEVEFEMIPGVYDVLEAAKPGSPQVWPDKGNIRAHIDIQSGDIEAGFAEADVIVENVYTTPLIESAHLEMESAVALLDDDGTLIVYASSQAPYHDRAQIARALAISENQVRVITPYVGGGFGAKDEAHIQIHAAMLAYFTGRPVSMVRTREESVLTHVKRHPFVIRYRSGAKRDGKLTAVHVEIFGDTGPYTNAGPNVVGFSTAMSSGAYEIPNARLEGYVVYTNNPISGAMRGFGAPQTLFAAESQMDALALELGISRLDIRLINGMVSGSLAASGGVVREGRGMKATLEDVAQRSDWHQQDTLERQPAPHLRRGIGIASSWFVIGLGRERPDHAGAYIEMARDGSVILRTGAVELGQGAFTAMAVFASEKLGVEVEDVRVIGPDTEKSVDALQTAATRQTFISGNAVLDAAGIIHQQLLEVAAEETGHAVEMLSLKGRRLHVEGEALSISVADLADKAWATNRRLHADGFYAMEYPQEFTSGEYPHGIGPISFGAQAAQVLVDIETGEVTIEKLWGSQNVGRIINYGGAHGQLLGGMVMGLGNTMMEELKVENGITLNSSLESYIIPTSADIPEMDIRLLEIPEPYGPMGAVGIGEPVMCATAPAITNAVADAIGLPIKDLPLDPEAILAAYQNKKEG